MSTRSKISDLLTPSQEAVYGFVSKSSRWLTRYEISKLTGSTEQQVHAALKELLGKGLAERRKRIYGFESGEWEYHRTKHFAVTRRERWSAHRLAGVEPLAKKLQRIVGKKLAQEIEAL